MLVSFHARAVNELPLKVGITREKFENQEKFLALRPLIEAAIDAVPVAQIHSANRAKGSRCAFDTKFLRRSVEVRTCHTLWRRA